MTAVISNRPVGLQVNWRTAECLAIGLALFIQTGAVFVLLVDGSTGIGGPAAKLLRMMALPGYLVSFVIIARYPARFATVVRRNLPLALLLLLPFLSVLWSISPGVSLRRAIGLLFSIAMAYVLVMRFSPRQLIVLVTTVLGISMMLSLVAAVAMPGLSHMPDGPELRGIFNHKNVLGWYAAFGLILSGSIAADRSYGLRPFALVVFVASLGCMVLSQSGTALITALSALLFTFFYMLLRQSGAIWRGFVILTAVQVVAFLAIGLSSFLPTMVEEMGKDVSLTGRVPLWHLVDQAIMRRPILGYGYQSFWTSGSGEAWVIWTKVAWPAPHSHNGYRDTLLSLGIVGGGLLLTVILRALHQGAVLLCRDPRGGWLPLNVIVAVFLMMNITESILLVQNSFLFMMFITAVLMFSTRATR